MPLKSKYHVFCNDQFGSWTVIEINKPKSRTLVRCICGFEKSIRTADLVTGRSRSCGKRVCFADYSCLLGMRFGFLSVLKITDERSNNGSIIWECKCICGTICYIPSKNLIAGASKSCGCKRAQNKNSTIGLLSEDDRATKRILNSYKRNAKRRNIEWKLSYDEFSSLISKDCHYCGVSPNKTVVIKRTDNTIIFNYNGIDRLDSNSDYTIQNCVTCCWVCNRAKLDMSYSAWVKWIDQLIKFQTNCATNIVIYV
jgi:5-methylcytosine-specific restriction endonuclease McrA